MPVGAAYVPTFQYSFGEALLPALSLGINTNLRQQELQAQRGYNEAYAEYMRALARRIRELLPYDVRSADVDIRQKERSLFEQRDTYGIRRRILESEATRGEADATVAAGTVESRIGLSSEAYRAARQRNEFEGQAAPYRLSMMADQAAVSRLERRDLETLGKTLEEMAGVYTLDPELARTMVLGRILQGDREMLRRPFAAGLFATSPLGAQIYEKYMSTMKEPVLGNAEDFLPWLGRPTPQENRTWSFFDIFGDTLSVKIPARGFTRQVPATELPGYRELRSKIGLK